MNDPGTFAQSLSLAFADADVIVTTNNGNEFAGKFISADSVAVLIEDDVNGERMITTRNVASVDRVES